MLLPYRSVKGHVTSCRALYPLLRLCPTVHIRLHCFGVLWAGELLAIGHPHHIRVNLQAVAIGVEEVERATATAAQIAATFEAMDQRPVDQFDSLGMEMGQRLEELIAVLDLKGNLLDEPLALPLGGHIHSKSDTRSPTCPTRLM